MSSRVMKDERLTDQPMGDASEAATKVIIGSGENKTQSVKITAGSAGY